MAKKHCNWAYLGWGRDWAWRWLEGSRILEGSRHSDVGYGTEWCLQETIIGDILNYGSAIKMGMKRNLCERAQRVQGLRYVPHCRLWLDSWHYMFLEHYQLPRKCKQLFMDNVDPSLVVPRVLWSLQSTEPGSSWSTLSGYWKNKPKMDWSERVQGVGCLPCTWSVGFCPLCLSGVIPKQSQE